MKLEHGGLSGDIEVEIPSLQTKEIEQELYYKVDNAEDFRKLVAEWMGYGTVDVFEDCTRTCADALIGHFFFVYGQDWVMRDPEEKV